MPHLILVDTNIFLRLTSPTQPNHALASNAIRQILGRGDRLGYTLQTASEFWNVCTRPITANGLGYSPQETDRQLAVIEHASTLLPHTSEVYATWRRLLLEQRVQGVQVHDAKLAAAAIAHSVQYLLTFNTGDFKRYSAIQPIHPGNI